MSGLGFDLFTRVFGRIFFFFLVGLRLTSETGALSVEPYLQFIFALVIL
jgi:hypothetical protein